MKTILLAISIFLLTSSITTVDYSKIEEKSVHVQVNGSDDLTLIPGEKAFFMAGEGVIGYNSKLSIKGEKTTTEFKQGTELIFYVRGWSQVSGLPLSFVKMDLVKGKRIASSKTGMTSDKDKLITSISYKAVELDKAKRIFKVTLNEVPSVGTWCVSFHRAMNGKFTLGSSFGKEGFCFSIVE